MNGIEKLYENAGIKPIKQGYCDWDCDCPYTDISCNDECPYWKYEDEAKYPPFTAEKQLEIIIFFMNNKKLLKIDYSIGQVTTNIYSELLARAVNNLWQDLTEEERKQIRDILV